MIFDNLPGANGLGKKAQKLPSSQTLRTLPCKLKPTGNLAPRNVQLPAEELAACHAECADLFSPGLDDSLDRQSKGAFEVEKNSCAKAGSGNSVDRSRGLRLIVFLALHIGMRQGVILKLRKSCLEFHHDEIRVTQTKTDMDRSVWMNETIRRELLAYVTKGTPYMIFGI